MKEQRYRRWIAPLIGTVLIILLAIYSDQQTIPTEYAFSIRIPFPPRRVCTAGSNNDACIYGVFVGVGTYQRNWLSSLPGYDTSMGELREAFVHQNLMRPEDGIVLVNANATRAHIRAAFASLAERMQPRDIFVYAYAGHGNRGVSSLYPRESGLFAEDLQRLFQSIPAKTLIVTMDSCMSGSFARPVTRIASKRILAFFSSRAQEDSFGGVTEAGEHRAPVAYYLAQAVNHLGIDHPVTETALAFDIQEQYYAFQRAENIHLVTETSDSDILLWRANIWDQ